MKVQLKRLDEQVVVITGASSGIGLATARMAAKKGAKVVVAARNDDALQQLVEEIRGQGGQAIHVEADVSSEDDVRHIADETKRAFGGFDTWVNNAGISVYGRSLEVPVEDMRRMFDTNYWGVVYGSRIACEHLRDRGGALINLGSEVSDVAAPLQGTYSASKHAIKGWTDALRMELQDEGAPISVTLIKPGPIDTPFPEHAKNYLQDQPKHAPPVYTPQSVAEAILYAATTPVRDIYVGSGAKLASTLNKWAPGLMDKLAQRLLIPGTHSGQPPRGRDALREPGDGMRERGNYPGLVRSSLYTRAVTHPAVTGVATLGVGVLAAVLWRSHAGANGRWHGPWIAQS
ncbi:MAG: SDR family oxidoreductase [Chloroflexota bacterium]|nr:SDR family oxidoreductase [Chloroflexota bacterium]